MFHRLIVAALLLAVAPAARAQRLYLDPQFDVRVQSGIVYGTAPVAAGQAELLLDLYEPVGSGVPTPRPVYVTIHGGGFIAQSRLDRPHVDMAMALAARGYTAVSMDYRLNGQWPVVAPAYQPVGIPAAAVEDLVTLQGWLAANADALGIDVTRLAMGGSSAGGITALHAAYQLDDVGLPRFPGVRAVVDLWGAMLGPLGVLEAGEAPVMVVHGTGDATVPFSFSEAVVAAAQAAGVSVDFTPVPGANHGFGPIGIPLATVFPGGETLLEHLIAFLHANNGGQTIRGKTLVVKNPRPADARRRRVVAIAREKGSANIIVGDPTVAGASLAVRVNDTAQTFTLPAGFWRRIRKASFRYDDRQGQNGPVRTVLFRRSAAGTLVLEVKLDGRHGPIDVVPPDPGADGFVVLSIGGGERYCVRYGADGDVTSNDERSWRIANPTEEGCPLG